MTPSPLDTVRTEGTFTVEGASRYRVSVCPADAGATRTRLAIVHGYGDHAGRYREMMTWLAARGVACHAFDQRGHGRSPGRRAYVRAWDQYLDDLRAFLALPELLPANDRTPRYVLGHSHGGLIVAVAAVRGALGDVAGCILSAPYLVNALPLPAAKRVAAVVLNVVWPWLLVPSGIEPEMMSSDPAMVEDTRRDALLLRCATGRWFTTHRRAQAEALAGAERVTLPLLVLHGDADPIADPSGAAAFHAAAGSSDKTLITCPGMLHEPLREANRARVLADMFDWITSRAGR